MIFLQMYSDLVASIELTNVDKIVWAEHSCNSLLGHIVLSRLASYIS